MARASDLKTMQAILLVQGLWDHDAGLLTDEQETELFRELAHSSDLWPKLNDAFKARVRAKLESADKAVKAEDTVVEGK